MRLRGSEVVDAADAATLLPLTSEFGGAHAHGGGAGTTTGGGASPKGAPAVGPGRDARIDVIKAAMILLVALEHSHRPYWIRGRHTWEVVLGNLSAMCTPAFLVVSGYGAASAVIASEGDSRSAVAKKVGGMRDKNLKRLLGPYLVASAVGTCKTKDAYNAMLGSLNRHGGGAPARFSAAWLKEGVWFAMSFTTRGMYYYTAVALACTLLLPSIVFACRTRFRSTVTVLATLSLRLSAVEPFATIISLFGFCSLETRIQPHFFVAYYVIGYAFRKWCTRMSITTYRTLVNVLGWLVVPYLLYSPVEAPDDEFLKEICQALGIVAVPLLVLLVVPRDTKVPLWVRVLSDLTYTIYLYHIYFVEMHYTHVTQPQRIMDAGPANSPLPHHVLQRWLGAVALCVAGAYGARAALGDALAFEIFGARFPRV